MRRRPFLAALALLSPTLALAETPAERASRQLQSGMRSDRIDEAGRPEGPSPATSTPVVRAMDVDRRSLQPDVGRPEETGSSMVSGDRTSTDGGHNAQR